jgi:hypothetical protein
VCALVLDHPPGEGDAETINLPRLAHVCAEDWGLWKTVTLSIAKVQAYGESPGLEAGQRQTLRERLQALLDGLEAAPKSLRWRARAKVGERLKWFELPEEVKRG